MSEPLQQMTFWPDAVGSTSLPEACRVSLRRLPGSDRVPRIPAGSGPSTCDSSWISDLSGYLRRTCQAFYPSGNPSRCSLTWKRRATKSGRLLWALGRSEPRTSGIGLGLSDDWLTPRTTEDGTTTEAFQARMLRAGARAHQFPDLRHQAEAWPTPRTLMGGPESAERKQALGRTESGGGDLQSAVQARDWFTPQGRDWKDTGPSQGNRKDINLGVQAHRCAGPPVPESRSTSGKRRDWSTPDASSNRKSARAMMPSVNNGRRSGGGQSSPPGLEQQAEIQARGKGQLNPAWVTQLQGLPDGWLDLPDAMLSRLSATRTRRTSPTSSGGG